MLWKNIIVEALGFGLIGCGWDYPEGCDMWPIVRILTRGTHSVHVMSTGRLQLLELIKQYSRGAVSLITK